MKSLEKDAQKDEPSGNYGVSNIYSEDQLTNILTSTKNYVVLKLFRVGCKKCEKLEPIYDGLARDPVYSKFQFLQADVAYVDTYKKKLKDRLMGMRIGQVEYPKE
jgi:thiol-disulfide isomerase/thioredoxin